MAEKSNQMNQQLNDELNQINAQQQLSIHHDGLAEMAAENPELKTNLDAWWSGANPESTLELKEKLNNKLIDACSALDPDPALVRSLIAQGADPKLKTKEYHYSLIVVTFSSICGYLLFNGRRLPDLGADYPDRIKLLQETIQILIENGVNVNEYTDYNPTADEPEDYDDIDFNGMTPLMIACQFGMTSTVEFLLANGAKVDQPGKYGHTPLWVTIEALPNEHVPILKLLISKGADCNHIVGNGMYPFRLLASGDRICPHLLLLFAANGAMCGTHPEDKPRIAARRFQISESPSVWNGEKKLQAERHFMILDSIDQLFHFARMGTLLVKKPIADLFNNGGHFNQRTIDGKLNTPLHLACEAGNTTALRALLAVLKQGNKEVQIATLSFQNKEKYTPLDLLAKHHPNLTHILMDAIQPLIDPMMMLIKQFPIFARLPFDVIQNLYPFYQTSSEGCFAMTEKGSALVQQMYERAHSNADFALGLKYFNGEMDGNDLKRAAVHFYRAAKEGHKEALFNLAQCYKQGKGVTQSDKMALVCYSRASKAGLAQGAYASAMLYRAGSLKNTEKYLNNLREAVKAKMPQAMFELALYYQETANNGTANNGSNSKMLQEALSLEMEAAKLGLPIANYKMGQRYEEGVGVEKDLNKACELYAYAHKHGIVEAKERFEDCLRKLQGKRLHAFTSKA